MDDETETTTSGAQPPVEPPEAFAPIIAAGGDAYPRVMKAIIDRPWAIQPGMLSMIVDIVRFRAGGNLLSEEEIAARLQAAATDNPDRRGDGSFDVSSVRVIPVYGVISQRMNLMSMVSGGTSLDVLRGQVQDALSAESVTAIVLQFDSPGGSVDGLPEFAAELRSVRGGSKPIVAIADTMAASAAYWLACQVDELVVTPSGSVGSVGVFAAHEDVSKAEELAGVKTTLVSAGPHKTEGNPHEPLTDEARTTIQDFVNAYYSMFKTDVAKGRNTTVALVEANYGGGREVLAQDALKAGMVDRVDTLENTVRRLMPRQSRASSRAAEAAPVEVGGALPDMPAIAAAAIPVGGRLASQSIGSPAARTAAWVGFTTKKGK